MDVLVFGKHPSLHVVDRILTAEDEEEEELGEEPAEHRHELCRQTKDGRKTGDIVSGTVHELLEHHPVVALFDRLVVGIPELSRAVWKLERVCVQPAVEQVLELDAYLRCVREPIQADPRTNLLRLRLVPGVPAE